ncbi:MAG: hypothetical protein ACTTJS_00265 [Wolinella sp.]
MSWLKECKIALLERNLDTLQRLMSEIPDEFETLEQMEEALSYLEMVRDIFTEERDSAFLELERIKKMLQFVRTEQKKSVNTHF